MEHSDEILSDCEGVSDESQLFPTTITPSQDELARALGDGQIVFTDFPYSIATPMRTDSSNDQINIDALINSANLDITSWILTEDSQDDELLLQILPATDDQTAQSNETGTNESIEDLDSEFSHQSVFYADSAPVRNTSTEPKVSQIAADVSSFLENQERLHRMAKASRINTVHTQRSATVAPVDYILSSHGCQPCTTTQMQSNIGYQEGFSTHDIEESKKIQILCQPRSKYRPRTQNESRNSAHYIRCEEGVKPDYPTIRVPQTWNFQADINIIEVALVCLDKTDHPYTIDNRNRSNTYEDNALIFKQNDPNVLYFRLTNEDFRCGRKTLLIEILKSKQDHIVTKEVIRQRQLEHSMLRFTRIFQLGKLEFERDEGSIEYSCVMSEAYGDVEVERMSPLYGPKRGGEMVYIILKGRILKNDLKIEIFDDLNQHVCSIENFTKNGNIVYFLMPPSEHPELTTHRVTVNVSFKHVCLHQATYLYKGSLDEELAELHLNDPDPNSESPTTSSSFDPFSFMAATGICPPSSRRSPTTKRPKRLQNNKS